MKLATKHDKKATSHTTLIRSQSTLNLHSHSVSQQTTGLRTGYPLRRVSSTSKLEVTEKSTEPIHVNVRSLQRFYKNNQKQQALGIKRPGGKINPRNSQQQQQQLMPGHNTEEVKSPKPILRKFSLFADETTKTANTMMNEMKLEETKLPAQTGREKTSRHQQVENTSPSKETTINGIPLSKLPRKKQRNSSRVKNKNKSKSPPQTNNSSNSQVESLKMEKTVTVTEPAPVKTVDELEREGARNFARCLLGILPSVLAATEPSVADDLLQQFASDVCEAVTCLTLKRKNVPNFGNVRSFDTKTDRLEKSELSNDPTLNADGVYKAVYETLKLNYQLNTLGYYTKSGSVVSHIMQVGTKG